MSAKNAWHNIKIVFSDFKMRPRFTYLLLLLSALIFIESPAQTRIFKNYGVKDGLASNTVYFAFQDKKGFMWFGTDQGLSKFDGSTFTNYTTQDGLPDNDVFRIAEDSQGRLWLNCYNSTPCFLYQGKMHNADNDTLLTKTNAGGVIFKDVCIDRQGRAWMLGKNLYLIDKVKVQKFETPGNKVCAGLGYLNGQLAIATSAGVYEMMVKDTTIIYRNITTFPQCENNGCVFFNDHCYVTATYAYNDTKLYKTGLDTMITLDLLPAGISDVIWSHTVFNATDTTLWLSAGAKGIKVFNNELKLLPDPFPFLPHTTSYTYTVFDRDGNTWVSSLGEGVFFIPLNKIINYKLKGPERSPGSTTVYKSKSGTILVGFDYGQYGLLKENNLTGQPISNAAIAGKKTVRFCRLNKDYLLLGTDFGLYYLPENNPTQYRLIKDFCIKNLYYEGVDSVLIGLPTNALRLVKTGSGFKLDYLWNRRTTALAKDKQGIIWLGTPNGLFYYTQGEVKQFEKNILLNKSRIADLLCDKAGRLWVTTNQRGLFIITPDSVYAVNNLNGLSDNRCGRMYSATENEVWLCTARNISKITIKDSGKLLVDISTPEEFSIDAGVNVNDILIDSGTIMVATSDGLLQIPGINTNRLHERPVYITSFKAQDSVYNRTGPVQLNYWQNNIEINYAAIAYNSPGKISYKYLLAGGDTVFTYNTTANFNSLPAGAYIFQLWAKTNSGNWNKQPATFAFSISPPYWKTWWFQGIIVLILLLGTLALLKWRIEVIRKREKEKSKVARKIAEVELQAVRAHMNEHFIFNSLGAIQNFINHNDTEAANFYLAHFGSLIRLTLDLSARPFISLKNECDYLNNYLTLEKMRFGEKFDYSVINNVPVDIMDETVFPSMILQPYVENAIRHGLRHKEEGKGGLEIFFYLQNDFIICRVTDNGVGRKKAAELKSKLHVEYQSKGIMLSKDKIDIFNRVNRNKISVNIEDLTDKEGSATGTRVTVRVPYETDL